MTGRHFRVARIITRLNIGGPSIQAIGLSRELAASGFDTCLIHGRLGEGEGDMTRLLPIDDVESVYVADLVRPIAPLSDVRAWWRIYRTLRRWQPDIVHTHMAKAGTLGRLAALAYNRTRAAGQRARLVHTYHGHVFEGYFGSPSTRLFVLIERWIGRRTDALIAISPQVARDLVHTYRIARDAQLKLIPLGFNLDRLLASSAADRGPAKASLELADDEIAVTTVGRLTAIKQHSLFLDMAARLANASPRFVFLIVGDGELRPALEARAAELGLTGRVRFLGWRGDLDTVYGASDIFVLTSRNEGTPVALIEAMAAGVAAVSTDVGGVRDVVTGPELGSLVPFGDAEALARAVLALADAPARRSEIGQAARASVRERFHATRLIADIRSLYWQLVEAAAPPVDPAAQ
ncbi:MAG: glycosyltransferase [Acidobacteria bacterium]|nr:glycosyltransferase [Acidobacteriota bacterium]